MEGIFLNFQYKLIKQNTAKWMNPINKIVLHENIKHLAQTRGQNKQKLQTNNKIPSLNKKRHSIGSNLYFKHPCTDLFRLISCRCLMFVICSTSWCCYIVVRQSSWNNLFLVKTSLYVLICCVNSAFIWLLFISVVYHIYNVPELLFQFLLHLLEVCGVV